MLDLKALEGQAFLMEPGALKRTLLRLQTFSGCYSARQVARARRLELDGAKQLAAKAVRAVKGKIGIIPVHGIIQQRVTSEMIKSGGTSCEAISAGLDALLSDASVEAIVLHVASPGGESYGVGETAQKIFDARAKKPIYSIADSQACSAGYWLASAAANMSITPGGDAASVGVYAIHLDESKALEEAGITVTMVQSGRYKTELAPHIPLSAEAKENMQASVDATHDQFVSALARNRGVSVSDVRKNFGQGRVLNAEQSLNGKLVDSIRTFEQLINRLTGRESSGSGRAAAADMQRLRAEQRERLREAV